MPRNPKAAARRWLRTPIALTRGALIMGALILGVGAGGGIVAGTAAIRAVAAEEAQDLEAEALTRSEVAEVTRRVLRIEAPTPADLERRVINAIQRCQRSPRCRRELAKALP